MERCSSISIREMQIKTTMRDRIKNNKCWQGCGEIRTLIHCCLECKMVQPLWKTVWQFFRMLNIELPNDTAISLLREMKTGPHKNLCMNLYSNIIHSSQKVETTWGAWVVQSVKQLTSGHDLMVRGFEPRIRLWADGSEPGACFRLCVSLSLCPSPIHAQIGRASCRERVCLYV